jgi:hemerythrin-like domain-containing protein
MDIQRARRRFLITAATVAAVHAAGAPAYADAEKETGATEDLMREHGVLRRALLVFRQSAPKLRNRPGQVNPTAVNRAARLFRNFGEDYHERQLEEAYLFPALRKAGGPAAGYVDVLVLQHERGREITDYILEVTAKGGIGNGDAEPLARAFEALDLMYENHAAREDTVVFPAWKAGLSDHAFREMSEKFEDIEKKQFGKDGFDDAVRQMTQIETMLGYIDIAQFTAPPPKA